jgi:hypothetical protein
MNSSAWLRVGRARHCPICDHADWCLIAKDGTAAICARTESPRRAGEAGWLHRLRDEGFHPPRGRFRVIRLKAGSACHPELTSLAAEFRRAADPGRLAHFAVSLGLSASSLCHLGIGWSESHRAWSFPMTDATGSVLGIRLRRWNGFKFAVTGGKEGLFVPAATEGDSSALLICEGPTDTAALLDMGFADVVGRPSCTGGIKLLVEFVLQRERPDVVIVADTDEPGRRGADDLASVLVAFAPSVRVVQPPAGIKDARDWLRAGATLVEVERAIKEMPVRRLTVRSALVTEGS